MRNTGRGSSKRARCGEDPSTAFEAAFVTIADYLLPTVILPGKGGRAPVRKRAVPAPMGPPTLLPRPPPPPAPAPTPQLAWENCRSLLAFACASRSTCHLTSGAAVALFATPAPLRGPRHVAATRELREHLVRCRAAAGQDVRVSGGGNGNGGGGDGTANKKKRNSGNDSAAAAAASSPSLNRSSSGRDPPPFMPVRHGLAAIAALAVVEETCCTRGSVLTPATARALASFLRPGHVAARIEAVNSVYLSNPAGRDIYVLLRAPSLRLLSRPGSSGRGRRWISGLVATAVICHAHEVLERVRSALQRTPESDAVFQAGVAKYRVAAQKLQLGALDNSAVLSATTSLKQRMAALGDGVDREEEFIRSAVAYALLAVGLALCAGCSTTDVTAMAGIVDAWRNQSNGVAPVASNTFRASFMEPFAVIEDG